jgi:hypothetical protein
MVEGLKAANEDGKLTAEEIAMIKQQALSKMLQLLTDEQKKIIGTIAADISAWLGSLIQKALIDVKLETGQYGTIVDLGEPIYDPLPNSSQPSSAS